MIEFFTKYSNHGYQETNCSVIYIYNNNRNKIFSIICYRI